MFVTVAIGMLAVKELNLFITGTKHKELMKNFENGSQCNQRRN